MALGPRGTRGERKKSERAQGDTQGKGCLFQWGQEWLSRGLVVRNPQAAWSIPEVSNVVGGPRQPDPGATQHVDKVGDTQNVLCRLKGRVPTPQDQHILTLEVLGVHGHRLVPLHVFGAREVNLVGDRQTGGHKKHAAGRGQMEDGLVSELEDHDVKITPYPTAWLARLPQAAGS